MLHTTLAAGLALAVPAAALLAPAPSQAQASAAIASGKVKPSALSPGEIVAGAPAAEWIAIAPSDLLVMTLAPDRDGNKRQVVIQLMPPPFSQGWIGNIRKLAAAHWWDGLSINRVQDNYVVQWGDAEAEDKAKAKALPAGLAAIPESAYETAIEAIAESETTTMELHGSQQFAEIVDAVGSEMDRLDEAGKIAQQGTITPRAPNGWHERDPYVEWVEIHRGWPLASAGSSMWPIHCYGMVGVGRDLSPDTGSGAELYTVIGHAPRHLDRNIALVGRVVEGIENLSSLPRGTGALGFYEKPEQRVPIQSIRLASELPAAERPKFEYLSTESDTFAKYADARANRRDPFFNVPAGGADICNIPVPVRRVAK